MEEKLKSIAHKYLRQSTMLIAALFLFTLLYVQLWGSADTMIVPLAVCVVFQLIACIIYGNVWQKVAASSPQSLPTLYLAASGGRMIAGLAVVVIYLFILYNSKDSLSAIRFFVITFLVFYLVVLAYDTAFFVKVEKTLKKNE